MRQRYVSEELIHFIGANLKSDSEQYELLLQILRGGELLPPGLRNDRTRNDEPRLIYSRTTEPRARLSSNHRYPATVVCFCDIPIADLEIHTIKYSRVGIGFERSFLQALGASPVFYVALQASSRFRRLGGPSLNKGAAFDSADELYGAITSYMLDLRGDPDIVEGWRDFSTFLLSDVFAYLKFFDPCLPEDHEANYYMEREWRVQGPVSFSLSDVRRLLVPPEYGRRLRADVPEYFGEVTYLRGATA